VGDVMTDVQRNATNVQPAVPTLPTAPTAPTAPQAPVAIVNGETPAPGVITIQRDGKTITINGATGGVGGGISGGPGGDMSSGTGFPFPSDIPPGVQSIATTAIVGFCMMVAAYPVFGFLKALVNRSASRQSALPSRDTTDRLTRIESAVDAMSVEVERISEGQRFVTKVLSERSSAQS
jgi:hypothetical protein